MTKAASTDDVQDSQSENLCGKCKRNFYDSSSKCIGCDKCKTWYHISCAAVSKQLYEYFDEPNNDEQWICKSCKQAEANQTHTIFWGKCYESEADIEAAVKHAYKEIIGWCKNLFLLPRGNAGKDFICELTRLISMFVNKTAHERFALSLVHILMPIMLQKPSAKSKARDHSKYLAKRLIKWKDGELVG